jgi:hypothetical protein
LQRLVDPVAQNGVKSDVDSRSQGACGESDLGFPKSLFTSLRIGHLCFMTQTFTHTVAFYHYICGETANERDSEAENKPPPTWLDFLSGFAELGLALLVIALLLALIMMLACVVADVLFAPLRLAAGLR